MKLARRDLIRLGAPGAALVLAGCGRDGHWYGQEVAGSLPDLAFTLTDCRSGRPVRAADFRGWVALLLLGYTSCPDVCPATLGNLAGVLATLGPHADRVRVLFVTVDPARDTPAVLRRYVAVFAPQVVGLRGTPDQLAALARRYRLAYSVRPAHDGRPYEVSHSAGIDVFAPDGTARLLLPSQAGADADPDAVTADLRRLLKLGSPNSPASAGPDFHPSRPVPSHRRA